MRKTINNVFQCLDFATKYGYPILLCPIFTPNGSGKVIAENEQELRNFCIKSLDLSPIHEVLVLTEEDDLYSKLKNN